MGFPLAKKSQNIAERGLAIIKSSVSGDLFLERRVVAMDSVFFPDTRRMPIAPGP